jgi:hypothetical protein
LPVGIVASAAALSIFCEFLPTVSKAAPTFFKVTVSPALGLAGKVIVNAVEAWLAISWSPEAAVNADVLTNQEL